MGHMVPFNAVCSVGSSHNNIKVHLELEISTRVGTVADRKSTETSWSSAQN